MDRRWLLVSLPFLSATASAGTAELLFRESDVVQADKSAEGALLAAPTDPKLLEQAAIAAMARGDHARVNALAVRRAALGDPAALPLLLFAWDVAHTPHDDAAALRGAGLKLLPHLSPAQAAPLCALVRHLDRMLGQPDTATADCVLPGELVDWKIVGPFENDQNSGFDALYPPEVGALRLTDSYDGKVGRVHWRPLLTVNPEHTVCLSCTVFPAEWGVAYLVTWVRVPEDTDAALWGQADDHLKVWVNRRLAISDDTSRRMVEGQDRAGVRLKAGWNQILVKVAQRRGAWAAGLRLTDLNGNALRGLTFSTEAKDTRVAASTDRWPLTPQDPVLALLADDPSSTARYLAAWRLQGLGEARASRLAFEQLVAAKPECALCWHGVSTAALTDEDRDRALTALSAALNLDPGFTRAALDRARIHRGMGLDDAAEDDLKRATATNPGDSEAAAILAEIRLKQGFAVEAARLAASADSGMPGWGAYLVLRAQAALALGDRTAAESLLGQALKADVIHWGATQRLFDLLRSEGRLDDAAQVYATWLAHDPESNDVRESLATVRTEAAKDALVREAVEELRRLNPDSPAAARLEGALCERHGDRSCAVAAFRQALRQNPSDWALRDHLAILEPTEDALSRFQVTSDEVRRRATKAMASDYPGANAVVLLREETFALHDDGSLSARTHFAVKVFDQSGLDHYLNYEVGKQPSLKVKMAGTLDESGEFHEVSSVDDGKVHFPLAKPGSTFEIIYTNDWIPQSMSDWWSFYKFQEVAPALEQRWLVQSPRGRALKTWKRGKLIEERREALPGADLVVFDARNEPPLRNEMDEAPTDSFRDMAVVSTFSNWDQVVRWARASVDDQLRLDVEDPMVKEMAARLTREAHTPDAKAAALANYVRREIHYNQADTDIYRWRAHPARRILETHYGDCKDKSTLFQALARNAGLQVDNAFVLMSNDGRTPTEIPTLWFNHAVAFLPPQSGLTRPGAVDLTDDEIGQGLVPFGIQSANAVVFKPGASGWRFEPIPFSAPEDRTRHSSLTLTIDPKGDAHATVDVKAHGLSAEELRRGYRNARVRSQFLDSIAGDLMPGGARVGAETVSGLNDLNEDLEIQMQVVAPNPLRPLGDAWLLKIAGMPDASDWTRQTSRETPLRPSAATELDLEQEIDLPAGLRVGRLPDSVHLDGPYLQLYLTAKQRDERTVLIHMHYQRKRAEISPAEFAAFRDAALQIQKASEVTLALRAATPVGDLGAK